MEINEMDDSDNAVINPICPVVGKQRVELCVPVSVHPYARVGTITTHCCGEPIITSGETCNEVISENCSFTVKQTICIEVPVDFGAQIDSGATFISCNGLSTDVDEETIQLDEAICEDEDEVNDNQQRIRLFGNR